MYAANDGIHLDWIGLDWMGSQRSVVCHSKTWVGIRRDATTGWWGRVGWGRCGGIGCNWMRRDGMRRVALHGSSYEQQFARYDAVWRCGEGRQGGKVLGVGCGVGVGWVGSESMRNEKQG